MNIALITLFPDIFDALNYGVVGRAIEQGRVQLHFFNPRDYTNDPNRRVDDRPYGGGPGMVMEYQPIRDAIVAAKAKIGAHARVVYLSPQGKQWNQAAARNFSTQNNLILLAGRYEGIDERLLVHIIDEEWSIGDYVLSGGELPAMVLIDSMVRLMPGVLGDDESARQDSFETELLDHSHYTRPEVIDGLAVPPVLLSGDHRAIAAFRLAEARKKTWQKRPDLVERAPPKEP